MSNVRHRIASLINAGEIISFRIHHDPAGWLERGEHLDKLRKQKMAELRGLIPPPRKDGSWYGIIEHNDFHWSLQITPNLASERYWCRCTLSRFHDVEWHTGKAVAAKDVNWFFAGVNIPAIRGRWELVIDDVQGRTALPDWAASYVYFVQQAQSGYIKIGFTADVHTRLISLQVSSPQELKLLYAFKGSEADEKTLHSTFADYHIRGEWFSPDRSLLDWINEHRRKAAA